MRWVYTCTALSFILAFMGVSDMVFAQGFDTCQLYGVVYVTENPREANFKIYIEESEAFADLVVFQEQNRLMADEPGIWYMADSPAFANFSVYIESNRGLADFAIYYTDILSFAGCKK
ncbi:MAG: hypothetical protein DHS20C17_19480 [Cyclobacteriaceae bacterium]|nr:MAG: hypothetical protein DHS20C17_19480 [Cyclobacteriaceae bacterium]